VSVLVNGSSTKEFSPKKGARKGDPLAPFLFLIATEGLDGVSRKAFEKNLLEDLMEEGPSSPHYESQKTKTSFTKERLASQRSV